VRHVAVHRDSNGFANGFLLVNAPVNWQIDYVVVHPDSRGQGIAASLVIETLHQAFLHGVPFVTLASKPALREFYETCGFKVVGSSNDANSDSPSPLNPSLCAAGERVGRGMKAV
jgi:GNAT superfamily N-acetyltransferase